MALLSVVPFVLVVSALPLTPCQATSPEGVDALPPMDWVAPVHPLRDTLNVLFSPASRRQPEWKRTLVWLALNRKPRRAHITAFCPRCGGKRTRWGTDVRPGVAAADPAFWGPGSVVWVGAPVNHILVIEDSGAAVKGLDRFDVCVSRDHRVCGEIGQRWGVEYVELFRAKPSTKWGRRPSDWEPPLPFEPFRLLPRVPDRGGA